MEVWDRVLYNMKNNLNSSVKNDLFTTNLVDLEATLGYLCLSSRSFFH